MIFHNFIEFHKSRDGNSGFGRCKKHKRVWRFAMRSTFFGLARRCGEIYDDDDDRWWWTKQKQKANTFIVIHTCTFLRLKSSFVLFRVRTQIAAAHLCARPSSMSCESFSIEFRDFNLQFYPPLRWMCWLCRRRRVIISRWNVCDKKCIMARTFVFSSFSFCFRCICTSSPVIMTLFVVPCTHSFTNTPRCIDFLRREWHSSRREEKKVLTAQEI